MSNKDHITEAFVQLGHFISQFTTETPEKKENILHNQLVKKVRFNDYQS